MRGQDVFQCRNECCALRIRTDCDAQMLVDARQPEVAHEDIALASLGRQRRRVAR